MSRVSASAKTKENALVTSFREITGASASDAARIFKKHKSLEGAIEAFYSDSGAQAHASTSSGKDNGKKLGDIWEKFKDPSDPKLIKIDGTMELCNELDIDPSSDSVLFCLATDLGSKATGEWEKGPWISGWTSISPNIDSIASMKAELPKLRTKLNSDPAYFKKVYMHTFDLAKAPGARTLALESACDLWNLYIPPALTSKPSALSRTTTSNTKSNSSNEPPAFTLKDLEVWIEFQKKKGKAVSRDTWSLFVDFIRSIDKDFEEYDEEAAWPSTIDDFVEHVRTSRGKK